MPYILGWLQGFPRVRLDNHPIILFRWVCFRTGGRRAEHLKREISLGRIRSSTPGPGGGDGQGESRGICRQPQMCLLKYYSKENEIKNNYNKIELVPQTLNI